VIAGKVLVVDDDASMLTAMRRLLGAAGLPCAGYESAEELLANETCEGAACVVSDLRMPGISGLTLLATLRSREVATPFILITAHDSPRVRAEAAASGALYLAKPFLGSELLDAIVAATERKAPP
jgi:FixJ family two-component response regulator